jgi:hypothetical protein
LACRFRTGGGRQPCRGPASQARLLPQRRLTWPGLVALEVKERVPALSFKSFGAFVAGAAERSKLVGDTGESDPQHWIVGFGAGDDHVLVTLHAISPEAMTAYSDRLVALFAESDAFREIWLADGMALMEERDG